MDTGGSFFCEFTANSVIADIGGGEVCLFGDIGRLYGEKHLVFVEASFLSRLSKLFYTGVVIDLKQTDAFGKPLAELTTIFLTTDNNDIVELLLILIELPINAV